MTRFLALPLAAALVAVAPVSAQHDAHLPADFTAARTAVRAALVGFDAPSAAKWFAADAVVDMQGQVVSGLPAIRDGWLPGMMADLSSLVLEDGTFEITDAEITETAKHVAGTPEGPMAGTHKMKWRKTAEGWRITRLDVY